MKKIHQEQVRMASEAYKKKLRQKAEKRCDNPLENLVHMSEKDVRNLVEELQIHQIELEIQNEELRHVQKTMEDTRNRYVSLFDNAPVGYVILDNAGIIKQINSTFARLLQNPEIHKKGVAFADLLSQKDAAVFRARFTAFFKNPSGKQIEAHITTGNGRIRHVQMEAASHIEKQENDGPDKAELLLMITDVTEHKKIKKALENALEASRIRELEIQGLLKGARAVLEQKAFAETARTVFDICSELIGSSSGYVALLSEDGSENEVLFLEAGNLPCSVAPDLPMPIRGLRQVAYDTGKAVFDNGFMDSQWEQYLPDGHVRLENVLFAPLVLEQKTVGLIGLANKQEGFTPNDARIAQGFAELAAIALQNSLNFEKRNTAEQANEDLIEKLQKSLANVKQLSGLLPICSHCKKIRDDQGYWNQIESYLDKHSDAKFSHGICQECLKKHYSEFYHGDDGSK